MQTQKQRLALWDRWTLPVQFVLAGGVVMALAALIVGFWVSARIEQGVVMSSAAAAADYVETFIAPLGDEFAGDSALSSPVSRALTEVFTSPAVAERVVSYKIWRPGGLVLMASDAEIVGRRFEESEDLRHAWQGQVAASYEDFDDAEDDREAALGIPLLEVYSPVHEYFTGDVIAVVEFYHNATELEAELADAQRTSWLVVGSTFLASGLLLFGIVQAGGRTIDRQRILLNEQLAETRAISAQNDELRRRVVSASSRATAQTEKTIRQVGADLHDGPAQHLALAALRLDSAVPETERDSTEVASVRASLDQALAEIRTISRGLALPDLDVIDMAAVIERAVQEHGQKTGMTVALAGSPPAGAAFDYAQKLCVYRFLQETLSNVARHAGVSAAEVRTFAEARVFKVAVRDDGEGFDRTMAVSLRQDGGQGLLGLIDRAESIGGTLAIDSTPGAGTTITLALPREEVTT
ncbi:sensor histidine kinase [Ostreiculturibacter nitratireducens]|uniref:sensor histidine kinase n=1 Tax=Ostreiculturibacter nitratireducens TaxID=3075226 RepID=UPI0031B578F6